MDRRCFHRLGTSVAHLVEHPPHLLVAHGRMLDGELWQCGLTRNNLYGLLRQRGIEDLSEVRYVVFEQRGQVSLIRRTERHGAEPDLVRDIVERTSSAS